MLLLKVFTFVFSLMIMLVALLLISGRYGKVGNKVDQWISTDTFFGRLNTFISTDRFLLNRLTGILIFTGSSYCMIYYLFYSELTGWAADISKAFSVVFGLAGVFVGMGLVIGGKIIRKINDKLSSWVSTDGFSKSLDKIVETGDWFYKHNVLAGVLLILACLLINLRLWMALLS